MTTYQGRILGRGVWALGLVMTALVAGCEWEGTDQDESVSQRYNWVSFSAVYRAGTNAYLVAGFGEEGNQVDSEVIATGNGVTTLFTGILDHNGITPNTLTISAAGFALTDNGNGALSGNGKTGTITYDTGAWSINLTPTALDAGTPIRASYQFEASQSAGSSGSPIYSLTVQQNGNSITMVDNNGATYSGTISSITGTGGASGDTPSLTTSSPATGDTVTGSFEVEGRSSSGQSIRIVGTLVGTVVATAATDTTAASLRLNNRSMHGTWIEGSGETGDIYGVAP